jgi:hypothetical protein
VYELCRDKSVFTFEVHKSVHHHDTIQINQPTRSNIFPSLLLDVYVWLKMFRAPLRPSSVAYNCTRSLWFYRRSAVGRGLARPRPTALQLPRSNGKTRGSYCSCTLLIGGEAPKTCWATHKHQVINLGNCCILLVDYLNCIQLSSMFKYIKLWTRFWFIIVRLLSL